jgi:hypothetical protein
MHPQRRSGRIAKQLPIVLLGTDAAGKVFAEETTTVVLSRHGAGVLSKFRFAPDEVLTLRLSGSAKEADVRLVGQIGGEPGRYVYGLTFVDPNLDFWPMDFPPPEVFEPASRQLTLECTTCHVRQVVEYDDIAEDVYSINGNVLRFCEECGMSTPWIKARGEAPPAASSGSKMLSSVQALGRRGIPTADSTQVRQQFTPSPPHSPSAAGEPLSGSSAQPAPGNLFPGQRVAASVPVGSLRPQPTISAYSGAGLEIVPTAAAQLAVADPAESPGEAARPPDASASTRPSVRPLDSQGRRINRRKHMRVRVAFSACVRQSPGGEDVVECENISKGGLCFHSKKRYPVGAAVEIAAPFSPGSPALFVPGKIMRVEPLGDGTFFRYGVAYLESKPES